MVSATGSIVIGMKASPRGSGHDPSAVLSIDDEVIYGIEEERLTREKHATSSSAWIPVEATHACLDYRDLRMADVDTVVVSSEPAFAGKKAIATLKQQRTGFKLSKSGALRGIYQTGLIGLSAALLRFMDPFIRSQIESEFGSCPEVVYRSHHLCHAASAFYPTDFDEALIITADGRGEYDATVIWEASGGELTRIKTFPGPNSLGRFFGTIAEFLGYRRVDGGGKVMGLAPYGSPNDDLNDRLRNLIDTGANYDVTPLTKTGGVKRLEEIVGRERRTAPSNNYTKREKDLAFAAQRILEEIMTNLVSLYTSQLNTGNVGLAGGVVLNCKMNKEVRELPCVAELFAQPVANDAGLALGATWLESSPKEVDPMEDVYLGPEANAKDVVSMLETNKIEYSRPEDVASIVAEELTNGALVGWFQGRMEMGPRALGNRSILADPRTKESRERVNEFVKHREPWRPFAPSILYDRAAEYFENFTESPFMIDTFDTGPGAAELAAVIHPSDGSTRPQTVREDQNPNYYRLIEEFYDLTGVPAVLNTSFNDHGEPIVCRPIEALKDFYGMGLDILVIEDIIVRKPTVDGRGRSSP